jgi:hypothetical protein
MPPGTIISFDKNNKLVVESNFDYKKLKTVNASPTSQNEKEKFEAEEKRILDTV